MRVQTTSEFTLWDQPLPGMGDPLLSDSMGLFYCRSLVFSFPLHRKKKKLFGHPRLSIKDSESLEQLYLIFFL